MCTCVFDIDRFKESVIEERKLSAEAYLQNISKYPDLTTSSPLCNFLKVRRHFVLYMTLD
jgi:hypothetical protein